MLAKQPLWVCVLADPTGMAHTHPMPEQPLTNALTERIIESQPGNGDLSRGDDTMTKWTDINAVAYCGLVCAGCSALVHGCAGCRSGGGTEGCLVRSCSRRRGFSGCWECTEKQCDKGPFGSAER